MLQQAGYTQLVCLTDSREVVEQFRIFKPHLVLLDLMMPKLVGYAVMTQLRDWIPDDVYLPVLLSGGGCQGQWKFPDFAG